MKLECFLKRKRELLQKQKKESFYKRKEYSFSFLVLYLEKEKVRSKYGWLSRLNSLCKS